LSSLSECSFSIQFLINPLLWGETLVKYGKWTLQNQQWSTEITKIMCEQQLFLINNTKASYFNVSSLTVFPAVHFVYMV
jgi:hypothetical protein